MNNSILFENNGFVDDNSSEEEISSSEVLNVFCGKG